MKIKEALFRASNTISRKEASILLSYILKLSKLELIMNEDQTLNRSEEEEFFCLVDRAKKDEPIEYITQSVSFYSNEFFIQKGALIPRPESEILVDKVVQLSKEFCHAKIAEIGVGSGALSIMIKKLNPNVTITATDISQEALNIAKINLKKHSLQNEIILQKRPLLDGIDERFDIIFSNPPYIKKSFVIDKNLEYEPSIALFAGDRGDELLKEIIDLAIQKEAKYLCCEMGYDQKESLESYICSKGLFNYTFYKDLAGFDRGFTLKLG
jgi:release factor glutamine methyltransferase